MKLQEKVLILIVLVAFAIGVGYIINSSTDNESDAKSNVTRTRIGAIARYVDHEYGVICYNSPNGTSCVAAPEVKQ